MPAGAKTTEACSADTTDSAPAEDEDSVKQSSLAAAGAAAAGAVRGGGGGSLLLVLKDTQHNTASDLPLLADRPAVKALASMVREGWRGGGEG